MNYLYYIGYAYTVYVAKQNPVKGFGETNIIRDHELTTADIVELQQSLGIPPEQQCLSRRCTDRHLLCYTAYSD